MVQCLQAYGFIRISYRIVLENTEYGESDPKYTDMDFSHIVKMADSECALCASLSRSLSSSTHSESVASNTSDSKHESTSYASSSLGHLRPPPRKKGKSMGQESPSLVAFFDVVLKNTEIGYKNTEIRLCAY